jgi:hypothetical protein
MARGAGHTIVSFDSVLKGLGKLKLDEGAIRGDLNNHWEVPIGEGGGEGEEGNHWGAAPPDDEATVLLSPRYPTRSTSRTACGMRVVHRRVHLTEGPAARREGHQRRCRSRRDAARLRRAGDGGSDPDDPAPRGGTLTPRPRLAPAVPCPSPRLALAALAPP